MASLFLSQLLLTYTDHVESMEKVVSGETQFGTLAGVAGSALRDAMDIAGWMFQIQETEREKLKQLKSAVLRSCTGNNGKNKHNNNNNSDNSLTYRRNDGGKN